MAFGTPLGIGLGSALGLQLREQQQLMDDHMGMSRALFGGISHLAQVKHFRLEFKEYSKEEFRNLSKEPMIKDILTGTHKMTKEEASQRIKEHLNKM